VTTVSFANDEPPAARVVSVGDVGDIFDSTVAVGFPFDMAERTGSEASRVSPSDPGRLRLLTVLM